MKILSEIKKVYHGTTTRWAKSIENGINLNKNRNPVDFGKGFYTTTNYKQAEKWAIDKASKINKNSSIRPLILEYEVNLSELKELKGKVFYEVDDNWGRFIRRNRTDKSFTHAYDYVYGNVADNNIIQLLNEILIDEKSISNQEFIERIKPGEKYININDQISFNTERAIKCLRLVKGVILYDFEQRRKK